jgi:hypothetical protein
MKEVNISYEWQAVNKMNGLTCNNYMANVSKKEIVRISSKKLVSLLREERSVNASVHLRSANTKEIGDTSAK